MAVIRPLPLYASEKHTCQKLISRFPGQAGLKGQFLVTSRKETKTMFSEEHKYHNTGVYLE